LALTIDKTVKVFNLAEIRRGDCVRVRKAGDATFRNGFVTKAAEPTIEILYCNTQNNATSYLRISATEAAAGLWEIYWTEDFSTIYHETDAESGGGAGA
jgi:hypothetical protein